MTYKTIISGRLEFGNARSFEKVLRTVFQRVEVYYKQEIVLNIEEAFDEEQQVFDLPRFMGQASDKSWRNTINLLSLIVEYAVAGSVHAWMLENGAVLREAHFEPDNEKAAVRYYQKGRRLLKEGKENEAREMLSKAIGKFARHSPAYERRAYVNFLLGNFAEAMQDYNKSIELHALNPEALLGRATVLMYQQDFPGAAADLEMATRCSIPHQPVYWRARRLLGECHLEMKAFEEAAREYRFFTLRKFKDGDPNLPWLKRACLDYGKVLLQLGKYEESVEVFNRAFGMEGRHVRMSEADQLLLRGIALQKAGKTGFQDDWKKAVKHGSTRAAKLLEETT